MRAPVAAQVRDCSLLLLKSLSPTIVGQKVSSLAFDKAVLPKRRKNLIDRRAAFGIHGRAAGRP